MLVRGSKKNDHTGYCGFINAAGQSSHVAVVMPEEGLVLVFYRWFNGPDRWREGCFIG